MKEILISSSVLIAAIWLLRFLFRSTISRRVQYALWLLVALRLLVPVSIGSSGWSVAAVTDQLPKRENSENIVTVVGGDIPQLAPRVPDPSLPETEQRELYVEYRKEWKNEVDRTKIETGGTPITGQDILRAVWYGGMAIMLLWFLAANLRFARKLRRTRVFLDGAESKYPVYLCDDIPSPCLFGLFRPTIYVTSEAAKDETRLRYVIAHEETHARHLDPLWSLVRSVCLSIWWFNPLVWLAAYCSREDCELACDEGALARLGESARVPYGETLLSLVPVRRGIDPMLTATTMTAGKRRMKDRIQRIAEHRRPLAIALAAVLTLTAIVCAATFTGAEKKDPHTDEPIAADLHDAGDAQLAGAFASVDNYVDSVRALLDSVCDADGAGEPISLRLYSANGDSAVESVGDGDARMTSNFRFYMNCLFRSVDVAFEPAELPASDENRIELAIRTTGDRLWFWEGTNDLLWINRSGTERGFRMVYAAGDTVAGDLMREWYDEAEFCALGGDYRKQDALSIPDRGQTWLEAAQEFCERFEGVHLLATPGSKNKYAFVRTVVKAAEEDTARFRSIGRIDENTWCFFLTTTFVPENERALNWSIAGNTVDYAGSDPNVPAGAYEYFRCGYAHRVADGWRCELVGTGW